MVTELLALDGVTEGEDTEGKRCSRKEGLDPSLEGI